MTLQLTNSLTRRLEPFEPLRKDRVGIYVCGVTVYDDCHIGHARAAVVFDTLVRYLRFKGYPLTYVRNFTDIDDKIIQRAQKEGVEWSEIGRRYVEAYYRDMGPLNLLKPDVEPKATNHIPEMIRLVETLVAKGLAYESGGDVYFAIDKFPSYGKLSGKRTEDLLAGARVEPTDLKRHPLDFALWKGSKPGEPSWPSPWGPGRPGWHLECSAMSMKYLGESFDLHGGGLDLIFPHHENEIAQSEGATGRPFVRMFLHNGFVNIREEKMSKSVGNIVGLKDIYKVYTPEALRLYLLSAHYRSPLDYSDESLRQSEQRTFRIYSLLRKVAAYTAGEHEPYVLPEAARRFEEAMDGDLNSPAALAVLSEALDEMGSLLQEKRHAGTAGHLTALGHTLLHLGGVLGLFATAPVAYIERLTRNHLHRLGLNETMIREQIDLRAAARSAKDWSQADAIRTSLLGQGIALEDSREGTSWRVEL
ncbi:MAG: cysteine--tRNA ligase [Nitrospirae bacterium]|nr:cysteine--tRNA ligase [Nitrospirota bacterium]